MHGLCVCVSCKDYIYCAKYTLQEYIHVDLHMKHVDFFAYGLFIIQFLRPYKIPLSGHLCNEEISIIALSLSTSSKN